MSMKKLINDPFNVVDELIDGFVLANAHLVRRHPRVNAVIRKDAPISGKVAVLIGGGPVRGRPFAGRPRNAEGGQRRAFARRRPQLVHLARDGEGDLRDRR